MHVQFCTTESDELGKDAIRILENRGCQTVVLKGNEATPLGAVAIFTHPNHNTFHWPGNCVRIAAHRLMDCRPDWVKTPFLIAIRPPTKEGGLESGILEAAKRYEEWLILGASGQPGHDPPKSPVQFQEFKDWRRQVEEQMKEISSQGISWNWRLTPGLQRYRHYQKQPLSLPKRQRVYSPDRLW